MTVVRVDDLMLSDESGFACSKTKLVEDGLPHLRPFNIADDGLLNLSQLYQIPASEAPPSKRELLPGDVLFNNTNSVELVGKATIVREPMVAGFSNHLTRIRMDAKRVEPEFFALWLRRLRSTGYFTSQATQWVSQAAFKTTDLRRLEMDLPGLDEQRRVVDLLARAEGIVRLCREAQQKAAELIPAIFVKFFGDLATNSKRWPTVPLGDVMKNGPSNGLYKHKSLYGTGTPILRIDGFYDGIVTDLSRLKRVQLDDEDELRRFALAEADIVINRVNSPEYLGKSAIIPRLTEPTVFESNMMRFSVDESRVLPEFVIALLQQPASRRHLLANAKRAINQSSINQQDVKSLPVPLPPVALQQAFVQNIKTVASICGQQTEAIGKARTTFNALLASAFQGT